MYTKEKEMLSVYISKYSSTRQKQIILLMIPKEEKEGWHYPAVKKLSAFLYRKTLKYHGDIYCFNCLNSFTTENKPRSHEKTYKNEFVKL